MNRNLGRQFTPDEVRSHVPGAFALGDVRPTDRFARKVIPLESVKVGHQALLDIHTEPWSWQQDEPAAMNQRKVARYQDAMKEGGAAGFPPVVVAANGDGTHEFLDGYHRMHAATALGIRHGVAYVRTNRKGWE